MTRIYNRFKTVNHPWYKYGHLPLETPEFYFHLSFYIGFTFSRQVTQQKVCQRSRVSYSRTLKIALIGCFGYPDYSSWHYGKHLALTSHALLACHQCCHLEVLMVQNNGSYFSWAHTPVITKENKIKMVPRQRTKVYQFLHVKERVH